MTLDEQTRQRQLNEQAAAWLFKLEDNASADTEARFRRWLEGSADHIQAFLEVTAIDHDLSGMDPGRQIDLDDLLAQVRAESSANIVRLEDATPKPAAGVRHRPRWQSWAAAAAIAGIIAVSGTWVWMRAAPARFATAIGEQRAVKLDDGSLVQLNTRSHIEVRFTRQSRDVELLDGEALFTVERDALRPFRVLVDSTVVQVMGTQFNVYRHGNTATVSVVSGKVEIEGQLLQAGETAEIDPGRIVKQPHAQVAKAIVWQQRQLSFDHAPIEYVAEQFNRYNKVQIRILNPAIRTRELEGVFNADEPAALIDFLSREKDVTIEQRENEILVR